MMQYATNCERSEILINGYVRHECVTHYHMSQDILQILFDYYYFLHGDWVNHNISLQFVGDNGEDNQFLVYMPNATYSRFDCHRYIGICRVSVHKKSRTSRHWPCCTINWRMHSQPTGGFTLRVTDIGRPSYQLRMESHDSMACTRYLGIYSQVIHSCEVHCVRGNISLSNVSRNR